MNELNPIFLAIGAAISAGYKLIKGNVLAVLDLLSVAATLKGVDFAKVKADLLALQPADIETLKASFDGAVTIPDAAVKAKVTGVADCLDQAVGVVEEAVKAYNDGMAVLNKFKTILGV